jgi:hypothetical protein
MNFIMAHAYNVKVKDFGFHFPKSILAQSIKNFSKPLAIYYSRISKIMYNYQSCEIQPIQRIFRFIFYILCYKTKFKLLLKLTKN